MALKTVRLRKNPIVSLCSPGPWHTACSKTSIEGSNNSYYLFSACYVVGTIPSMLLVLFHLYNF